MAKDLSMKLPRWFGTFAEANSFAKEKRGAVLTRGHTGFVVWSPKDGPSPSDWAPSAGGLPEEVPTRGPLPARTYPVTRPPSATYPATDWWPPAPTAPSSTHCHHGQIKGACDVCWTEKTGGSLR